MTQKNDRVDLSLPYRLSNFNATTVLELIRGKNKISTEESVNVALTGITSERKVLQLKSSTTLGDIVLEYAALCLVDAKSTICSNFSNVKVIYIRSVLSGNDILTKTLSSLGIHGGSISLRIRIDPMESVTALGNLNTVAEETLGESKRELMHNHLQTFRSTVSAEQCKASLTIIAKNFSDLLANPRIPKYRRMRLSNATVQQNIANFSPIASILKLVGYCEIESEGTRFLQILNPDGEDHEFIACAKAQVESVLQEIVQFPEMMAPELQVSSSASTSNQEPVALSGFDPFASLRQTFADPVPSAPRPPSPPIQPPVQSVVSASFDPFTPVRIAVAVNPESNGIATVAKPLEIPDSEKRLAGTGETLPTTESSGTSPSQRTSSAPSTPGKMLTSMEMKVEELKKKAREIIEGQGEVERNTTVILHRPATSADTSKPSTSGGNDGGVSSSATSVTSASVPVRMDVDEGNDPEAARLYIEFMRKKIKEQQDESKKGFTTRAMRELDALKNAKVFTTSIIRVTTPDRTILQGTFSPLEPVSALFEWIRSLLRPVSVNGVECQRPFFLYLTPPPTLVQCSNMSLTDAKLVPAVRLYLGWGKSLQQRETANIPQSLEDYITESTLENYVQNEEGLRKCDFPSSTPIVKPPQSPEIDLDEAANALLSGGSVSTKPTKPSSSGSRAAGKPAWLKL